MIKRARFRAMLPVALCAGAICAADPPEGRETDPAPDAPNARPDGLAATPAIVRDEIRPIRDDLAPLIRAAQERFRVPGLSLVLVRGSETCGPRDSVSPTRRAA